MKARTISLFVTKKNQCTILLPQKKKKSLHNLLQNEKYSKRKQRIRKLVLIQFM